MQRIAALSEPIMMCSDASASLTMPPSNFALVPAWWSDAKSGVIPQFDVDIWANAARALTGVELFAAELKAFTFADLTVTPAVTKAELDLGGVTTRVDTIIRAKTPGESGNDITIALVPGSAVNAGELDESAYPAIVFNYKSGTTTVTNFETAITASTKLEVKTGGTGANVLADPGDTLAATPLAGGTNTLGAVAHAKLTGDGAVNVQSSGAIPTGLAALTSYWLIKDDADTLRVAASFEDAMLGVAVPFSTVGSGVVKVVAVAATQRVHWHSHGLLGPAGDGAISLDAQLADWSTHEHRARAIGYSIKATFGAGGGDVSAAIYPVVDVR